ncbi:MAG: hypothetical protein EXS00_06070 [Phycisphaerales bacterium]|nr:hypothetical protein [Phycisphaerales bacterium]
MAPTAPSNDLPASPSHLVSDLVDGFRSTAESVVPWFLAQMPSMYFQDTSLDEQRAHLRAIIAARNSGRPLDLILRSEDGRRMTALRPANRPGILAEIVATLPMDASLRSAKIHTSADGTLVLDTFEFGERVPFDGKDVKQAAKVEQVIAYARQRDSNCDTEALRAFLHQCAAEYVLTLSPYRLTQQRGFYLSVSGTDQALVHLESESDPTQSRITIAVANARTRTMLERVAIVLARAGISIQRAYLDLVPDPDHGSVTFLGFVVQTSEGVPIDESSDLWKRAARDLMRIKWIDFRVIEFAGRHPQLDLAKSEAIHAFAALVHQALSPINPFAFARDRVLVTFESNLTITLSGIELFLDRFNPAAPLPDAEFNRRRDSANAEIDARSDSDATRSILRGLMAAIDSCLVTNYYLSKRLGLAMRIDPALLRAERRPDLPYGVYFVHGRGFNGFHARFKEIARGGLRVVRPSSTAQFERESERLYDEVYGLASAQQLKNKDIPEGGAKAAILLDPAAETNRCVKAFVDCLLDLITVDPAVKSSLVNRCSKQEFIYLGPDENITPDHIDWIVARARYRKYPLPGAFMSSKPGAGINHKVYGVTSEGVNVFLRIGLLARGIDPSKQRFTVKITGGPDGDVAGNMMKILRRDYGDNARVVGVADGSGSGEDPEGLNLEELERLFVAGLPIAHFNCAKLSRAGRIVPLSAPDGAALRNSMHNRVVADAFIPGGGRPSTINERNWREFLLPSGAPSSGLIVEGANLYLTPEARVSLGEAGALIFKDSSANKCGVICSSYEIGASMLLDEAGFLAIKSEFVAEVLEKLRGFAKREAVLLLGEAKRHPGIPLPELSVRLSRAINSAADAIEKSMTDWPADSAGFVRQVVLEHMPPKLFATVGEALFTGLPTPYLHWIVAKSLASRIVYREGIEFFASMDVGAVGEVVLDYLHKDREMRALLAEVRASGLKHSERIATLLERAGTRAALLEI